MNPNPNEQQELPQWKSEQPTLAGPPSAAHADNMAVAQHEQQRGRKRLISEGCCMRCNQKCGILGLYFQPLFGRFGYSLVTAFYHLLMFPFTLAVMIAIVTMWSVSVGLLILIFGFILYWWTCEIAVIFARIDLALAYYMVEDNYDLINNRSHTLQLSLYKQIGPCPCAAESRLQGGKCCDTLVTRMKSIALRCDTYKILLFQAFFKPLVVFATCWIFIVVVYNIASVFAPLVYIIDHRVFTRHYWCVFGGTDCNGGECKCEVIAINNFGESLLLGICAFLILPLTLWVSIGLAKLSKVMSYFWLTNYYSRSYDAERDNLLVGNNSGGNSNNVVSGSNNNGSNDNTVTQTAIVHSVNNPYDDIAQV